MTATLQLFYDADHDRLHGTVLGADTSAAYHLRAGADLTVGADDAGGVVEFAIENFADFTDYLLLMQYLGADVLRVVAGVQADWVDDRMSAHTAREAQPRPRAEQRRQLRELAHA
ncbi:hypothetical protein [Blastococcus sp. SYSU DS1024]